MGQNMVLHLLEQGIDVVGYNRTTEVTEKFVPATESLEPKTGAKGSFTVAHTIPELRSSLTTNNSQPTTSLILWLMVPNGKPVDDVIAELLEAGMSSGDIIIDGGNCFYKDSVRRTTELSQKGITYIDCGTSGGLEGARNGACLMIGGDKQTVELLKWLWDALAVKDGWNYFGPSGAGHFVKMVHNGVEYGMNQALAEGFSLLANSPYQLNLPAIAQNWSHGSVVRGWLTELLAKALSEDPTLDQHSGSVGGGQTGQWTIETAKELNIPVPVITDALQAREDSQKTPTFAGKVVSALRFSYGGHK